VILSPAIRYSACDGEKLTVYDPYYRRVRTNLYSVPAAPD
jgi:hypothetical protein